MYKPATMEERVQYKNKMAPVNSFKNTSSPPVSMTPYPSVLPQTSSKKKISPRKVQRQREDNNNSQEQSYTQAGRHNMSHSYVQT